VSRRDNGVPALVTAQILNDGLTNNGLLAGRGARTHQGIAMPHGFAPMLAVA
jgi:hypothetical protein